MKFIKKIAFAAMTTFLTALLINCAEEETFTGIKFTGLNKYADQSSTVEFSATYYKDDKANNSVEIAFEIYSGDSLATLSSAASLSGQPLTLTTKTGTGLVGIKATANGSTAYGAIGVKNSSDALSADDFPIGFAYTGVDMSKMTNKVTVKTASELQNAVKTSGNLVIVEGTIDMSNGMLPEAGKKMDGANATSAMDAYVAANSSYKTYAEWITKETKTSADADKSHNSIRSSYTSQVLIQPASNVAIIGKKDAVIRGGYIKISGGKTNIVIRNLTIQDGVDPFPNHEKNDGWNAQHDAIGLDNGSNIWFDHLTIEDTLYLGTAANNQKLQVYDGLLDMKEPSTKITVSHCILRNHDKTMLIGTGDKNGNVNERFITLAYNNFHNCGQRLPMVRNTRIHVMNNLYTQAGGSYSSQSSINARAGSLVWDDNNWFEGGASPSANGGSFVGEGSIFDVAPRYPYFYLTKAEVKAQMGAGWDISY